MRGRGYWGLAYFNRSARFGDANDALHAFARFADGGGSLLLVVANFAPGRASQGTIRVPEDLALRAGLSREARCRVRAVLDERGRVAEVLATGVSGARLGERGVDVVVANQSAKVLVVERE